MSSGTNPEGSLRVELDEKDRAWYVQSLTQTGLDELGPVRAAAETLRSASDEEQDALLLQLLDGPDRAALLAYGRGQRWGNGPCGYSVSISDAMEKHAPWRGDAMCVPFHVPEKPVGCERPLGDLGVAYLETVRGHRTHILDGEFPSAGLKLGNPLLPPNSMGISWPVYDKRNSGKCGMEIRISSGEAYQYQTWYCQECGEKCAEVWREAVIRQGLLPNETEG